MSGPNRPPLWGEAFAAAAVNYGPVDTPLVEGFRGPRVDALGYDYVEVDSKACLIPQNTESPFEKDAQFLRESWDFRFRNPLEEMPSHPTADPYYRRLMQGEPGISLSDWDYYRENYLNSLSGIETLAQELREWLIANPVPPPGPPKPSLDTLVGDLQALTEEFGAYNLDRDEYTLSVVAGPFVLWDPETENNVDLGKFRIKVRWLSVGEPYVGAEALTPNECNGYTHPHVSGEHICLGEAKTAVYAALQEGRLLDAFLLTKAVLGNYSESSPYVKLSAWFGADTTPCGSCDDGIDTEVDNYESCHNCDILLCDSCSIYCSGCDHAYCSDHYFMNNTTRRRGQECADCGNGYCRHCLEYHCEACEALLCESCGTRCDNCEGLMCPGCINEAGFCGSCQEAIDEAEESENEETETGETNEPASPPVPAPRSPEEFPF